MSIAEDEDIPGRRGHTRTTWRNETGLRGLLMRLRKLHPKASRSELEKLYMVEYKRDDAFIEEAVHRVFANDMNMMLQQMEPEPKTEPVQSKQKSQPARHPRQQISSEVVAAEAVSLVERAKIVMLDLVVLPNGKALRDCTGKDCRAAGGWLVKIADRIGDRGVVGKKMSEAEVASIFAGK